MSETRLAELIIASHKMLRRPDLHPGVRRFIERLLARAQAQVRSLLA